MVAGDAFIPLESMAIFVGWMLLFIAALVVSCFIVFVSLVLCMTALRRIVSGRWPGHDADEDWD